MSLLTIAVAVGVAIVALEMWGRRPHIAPIESRFALRETLALLSNRGVHGTSLRIRLGGGRWDVIVTKQVSDDRRVTFLIETQLSDPRAWGDASAGSKLRTDSELTRPTDGLAHLCPSGKRVAVDVEQVMDELELAAKDVNSSVFPKAMAQFSGPVLAFNVTRLTGRDS